MADRTTWLTSLLDEIESISNALSATRATPRVKEVRKILGEMHEKISAELCGQEPEEDEAPSEPQEALSPAISARQAPSEADPSPPTP